MKDKTLPTSAEPSGAATEQIGGEGETPESTDATKDEKLHQTVDIRDAGPCKKHIKVTVDRGDIDKLLDEKFSELVKEAAVPGFRPGKAPRKVITRRFHKEV